MSYRKVGKGMMIIALILAICVVLMIQPLTEPWIGLLSLVFFLYAAGLAFTAYRESTSQQQEKHREIMMRLDSIEDSLEEMRKEQKEQSSSGSTIVPTLQAFSELYLDYLARQKSKEEQQKIEMTKKAQRR